MGKKGERLLRFLRSSKSKSSSDELKKNLSSLQEKRVARPNDYFKTVGKADLEMGSDARPHKIPVDYEELKISPEKVVPNNASTQSTDAILSPNTGEILTRLSERKKGDVSNHPKSEHYKFNGKPPHDIPVSFDTPPRLTQHPTTKRHPPNSKMDDSSGEDVPEVMSNTKCYKKEFPRKKARSISEEGETSGTSDDKGMRTITIQSGCPCSSATQFPNGSFRPYDFASSTSEQPSSGFQPENHCQDDLFAGDEDFRTQNTQMNRKYPITFQQHHNQYRLRQQHAIYINDEQDFCEFIPQTPKLAFTVTDKEGKGIELTIAVYGASSSRSTRNGSRNGSRNSDTLHLIERRNGFQQSTSRKNHPNEVRYENFTARGELHCHLLHASFADRWSFSQ